MSVFSIFILSGNAYLLPIETKTNMIHQHAGVIVPLCYTGVCIRFNGKGRTFIFLKGEISGCSLRISLSFWRSEWNPKLGEEVSWIWIKYRHDIGARKESSCYCCKLNFHIHIIQILLKGNLLPQGCVRNFYLTATGQQRGRLHVHTNWLEDTDHR